MKILHFYFTLLCFFVLFFWETWIGGSHQNHKQIKHTVHRKKHCATVCDTHKTLERHHGGNRFIFRRDDREEKPQKYAIHVRK